MQNSAIIHKGGYFMSIYDIQIKSADSEENFLDQFKGKVSLIVNVTGDCGNAPQYGIIETIYRKYKDQGFEVIAVPTNDFCGAGLTYGDHVYGTGTAADAREFAEKTFNVTYKFSELVESNPAKGDLIPGLPSKYGQVTPHEIFKTLGDEAYKNRMSGNVMGGNFEKYLIGRDGKLIKHYPNSTLLDYNYNRRLEGLSEDTAAIPGEDAYRIICDDIEAALAA
jgi:glutathione peroxidase